MKKFAIEEHIAREEDMTLRFNEPRGKERPFPLETGVLEQLIPVIGDSDETRLEIMDRCDIQRAVLMNGSTGTYYVDDPQRADELCQNFNDYLFDKVVAGHPDRYMGFATLPFTSSEQAAAELRRVMKKPGCVGSTITGNPSPGHYIDEDCYEPLWEAAEETGAFLYIHPGETPLDCMELYRGYECLNGSTWSWGVDTATYVLRIIFSGVFDRHPNVKIIVGHLAEMLPFVLQRIDNRWKVSPMDSKNKKLPSEYMKKNVWMSISGNPFAPALKCCIEACGANRIMFAVDYPFESMDEFSYFIDHVDISEEERELICWKNAANCFGNFLKGAVSNKD